MSACRTGADVLIRRQQCNVSRKRQNDALMRILVFVRRAKDTARHTGGCKFLSERPCEHKRKILTHPAKKNLHIFRLDSVKVLDHCFRISAWLSQGAHSIPQPQLLTALLRDVCEEQKNTALSPLSTCPSIPRSTETCRLTAKWTNEPDPSQWQKQTIQRTVPTAQFFVFVRFLFLIYCVPLLHGSGKSSRECARCCKTRECLVVASCFVGATRVGGLMRLKESDTVENEREDAIRIKRSPQERPVVFPISHRHCRTDLSLHNRFHFVEAPRI